MNGCYYPKKKKKKKKNQVECTSINGECVIKNTYNNKSHFLNLKLTYIYILKKSEIIIIIMIKATLKLNFSPIFFLSFFFFSKKKKNYMWKRKNLKLEREREI
jgi:hypothetical protein